MATIAAMAKKDKHVSQTPATAWLRQQGVVFSEHVYEYVEHGGTEESARQLGLDEHSVVKTLVMQDAKAEPLIVVTVCLPALIKSASTSFSYGNGPIPNKPFSD